MCQSDGFHYLIYWNLLWLGECWMRCWTSLASILFTYVAQKALYGIDSWQNVITWSDLFRCLKWYGAPRELTTFMIILPGIVRIVCFLVVFGLLIGVAFICCASTLEMWSTTLEAWSWFFCIFYLICWYFWGLRNQVRSSPWLSCVHFAPKAQMLLKQSSMVLQ